MVGNRASYEGQEGTCARVQSGVVGEEFLSRPLLQSPVFSSLFLLSVVEFFFLFSLNTFTTSPFNPLIFFFLMQ